MLEYELFHHEIAIMNERLSNKEEINKEISQKETRELKFCIGETLVEPWMRVKGT